MLLFLSGKSFRACSAIFTFVSLGKDGKPQPLQELKLETDAEKLRAEMSRKRYMAKKERRKRKLEAAAEANSQQEAPVRQMSVN